jgi:hypothetical protein
VVAVIQVVVLQVEGVVVGPLVGEGLGIRHPVDLQEVGVGAGGVAIGLVDGAGMDGLATGTITRRTMPA